jgi:hypothetical protein
VRQSASASGWMRRFSQVLGVSAEASEEEPQ